MEMLSFLPRYWHAAVPEVDVCLIAEGCYPYVAGGVSTWIDWLIRSQPDLTFSILSIQPTFPTTPPRYARPDNLKAIHHICLDSKQLGQRHSWPAMTPQWHAETLSAIFTEGNMGAFRDLLTRLGPPNHRPKLEALLNSPQAWETLLIGYQEMPQTAFLPYFWAWRTLAGGLLRTLIAPLPSARLYHSVSTGYAGLVAARASIDTGKPAIITEHGIYSNERRVEILMADWIENSIDTGFDFSDDRQDVRDFWANAFENFARIAYGAVEEVIALYKENNDFQLALGADKAKLSVVPNGVDIGRFEHLPTRQVERPTLAFIGRVTPIKDVQTFIDVAHQLTTRVRGLRVLIVGPMDEDPEYAETCIHAVRKRGLEDVVTFTGQVNVQTMMSEIDVLMLTSISEALPLVILEAGAAGIPCIATDVGACRELLGCPSRPARNMQFGAGGIVSPVGDVGALAEAATLLLNDKKMRETMGLALQRNVRHHYRSDVIAHRYRAIYDRHLQPRLQTLDA